VRTGNTIDLYFLFHFHHKIPVNSKNIFKCFFATSDNDLQLINDSQYFVELETQTKSSNLSLAVDTW
jgi:hypothetical protein